MSQHDADRKLATKRRETVTEELLEILTRERPEDEFSEVVLRAHLIADACGIKPCLDQISAAGAIVGDQMRRECLLAAAVMLLNRLIRN
ncbi:MAG TPA: hypothetical protein VNY04_02865 [Chthoniobacterales bacterium]|jgi:hypothetical protein|nr:hypothetical protein [Chthoniobacterales bacterium]